MTTVVFKFPMGAGGNWLNHLCHCLENCSEDNIQHANNFHQHKLSQHVIGKHFTDNYDFMLSTQHTFNLFVNNSIKNEICNIPDNWYRNTDQYVTISNYYLSAEWHAKYVTTGIDLDISWTSTDPERFINTLFRLLDLHGVAYTPDIELCMRKIKQFKETCINPNDYIGDLDNKYWQVWCLVFFDRDLVLTSYENTKQIKYLIQSKHKEIMELTKKLSYVI